MSMDSQSELNFEYNKLPQRGGGTPEPPPGLSFFTLNLWGGYPPLYPLRNRIFFTINYIFG